MLFLVWPGVLGGWTRVGAALDSRSIIQAEGREGGRREIRT